MSAVAHIVVIGVLIAAAAAWRQTPDRVYIVNLVPALGTIGVERGQPKPLALPPRPTDLPTRMAKPAPDELPQRETGPIGLPDRSPTRQPSTLPRSGEKELPSVAAASPRTATPRREATAPPLPPLGRPTGSAAGAGAVTLNVGDFPFTWYLQAIQRKISDKWTPPLKSNEGQQVVAVFEIGRDGQIRGPSVEKTSGDFVYDQAALRAITEATPFPPLPTEYKEPSLRIHLGFNYTNRG